MKKVFKTVSIATCMFILTAIGVLVSCNKKATKSSLSESQVSTNVDEMKFINGGITIIIVEVELRRRRGEKKKAPQKGIDCDCNYCFGLCIGHKIADGGDLSNANAVIEDLGGGVARIYLLEEPSSDSEVDPTFYVDDDVVITDGFGGTEFITILANEYAYSSLTGTVDFDGTTYSHYGTVDVNFTE